MADQVVALLQNAGGPTVLPAPTLLSPPDGAVFDNLPRMVTLVWSPVPGAASYGIEWSFLSPDNHGNWAGSLPTTTETHFTFEFFGANPGRWRVQAISKDGTKGPYSPILNFRYSR
jgi:hypothetical protein